MKETRINSTITGFVIGMILVAMFGTIFGLMISNLNEEYGMAGDNDFEKYSNYTATLNADSQKIRDATKIEQQEGWLDVVGGYFSSGYAALKTSVTSFGLFETMMDDAATDVEEISIFKPYLIMIILMLIFVGVVISALLKSKV